MCRMLAVALLGTLTGAARLDAADPLRLIPKEAGIVLKFEKPRQFVETVAKLDIYKNARQFPQVRELLDSTPYRRFYQLVAHLEQQNGSDWPELLDKLAGGGIAVGVKVGTDPAPAVMVIQGTDEAAVAKTFALFVTAAEEDAGRDGGKAAVTREKIGDVEAIHFGPDAHAARIGAAVVASNKKEALAAAVKLAGGKGESVVGRPELAAARKLVGGEPVAWGWFDLAATKATQASKDFFAATRQDFLQTLVVGSTIDAARRADFVAGGLFQTDAGMTLSIRLPAKRADLDHAMSLHAPKDGRPGSLPLLEPKGVIASQSFYLDLAHLWKERTTLLNDEIRGQLEKADKDLSKVLPGPSFGKLLEQTGAYHRLVAAYTGEKLYSREPGQVIPPAAVVTSMKSSDFGKSMDGVLRGAAFFAGFQTGWAMKEETIDGVKVVSYRFPEKGEPKFDDPTDLRFNFVPSFAVVGDALVVGSTPGIVKLLIPELRKESKGAGSAEGWKVKGYAGGGADALLAAPDATITALVLGQGLGLTEATAQVKQIAAWVRTLGTIELSIDHAEAAYKFDVDWKYGK